jgi:hypothetical protein
MLVQSEHIVNGQRIFKVVTFNFDGTWSLSFGTKIASLEELGFSNHYAAHKDYVQNILNAVRSVKMCVGRDRPAHVLLHGQITESFSISGDENSSRHKIRSKQCNHFLSFLAPGRVCRTCQKMVFEIREKDSKGETACK